MMKFNLTFTEEAKMQFLELERCKHKISQYKAVAKTLGLMQIDLRHPSLNTHKYDAINSPFNAEVFESYAQNKTPGAYRIFWYYGPKRSFITILAITSHP